MHSGYQVITIRRSEINPKTTTNNRNQYFIIITQIFIQEHYIYYIHYFI
jgi:hypothetical protein